MEAFTSLEQRLVEKVRQLSPEQMAEVEGFVDRLSQHSVDTQLTLAATRLSEPAFAKVWDNPDDAEYDNL